MATHRKNRLLSIFLVFVFICVLSWIFCKFKLGFDLRDYLTTWVFLNHEKQVQVQQMLDEAEKHFQGGEFEISLGYIVKVIAIDPSNRQAGQLSEKMSEIFSTIEKLFTEADHIQKQGRFDDAVRKIDQISEMTPIAASSDLRKRIMAVYNNIGAELIKEGLEEKAISCFQKVLVLNSEEPVSLYNITIAHFKLKKYKDVTRYGVKAITMADQKHKKELKNAVFVAFNTLGNVAFEAKDYSKAMAYFVRALEINDDYPVIWKNLAGICYETQQYHECLRYAEKTLVIYAKTNEPNIPPSFFSDLYTWMGLSSLYVGELEQALLYFEEGMVTTKDQSAQKLLIDYRNQTRKKLKDQTP